MKEQVDAEFVRLLKQGKVASKTGLIFERGQAVVAADPLAHLAGLKL